MAPTGRQPGGDYVAHNVTTSSAHAQSPDALFVYSAVMQLATIYINIVTLVALLRSKPNRNNNNNNNNNNNYRHVFIANICLSFIVNSVVCLASYALELAVGSPWIQSNICMLTMTMTSAMGLYKMHSFLALVLEQFISIAIPLRYHFVVTKPRICLTFALITLLSIIDIVCICCLWDWGQPCTLVDNVPVWYYATVAIGCLPIPLVAILLLQLASFILARGHLHRIRGRTFTPSHQNPNDDNMEQRKRILTTLIAFIVLHLFLTAHASIVFVAVIDRGMLHESSYVTAVSINASIQATKGCWIPIIYFLRTPELKRYWLRKIKRVRENMHI